MQKEIKELIDLKIQTLFYKPPKKKVRTKKINIFCYL